MDRKLDELLFALMQNMTIAVSGEKLARDLDVSHSTLVRWIEKLRAAGVDRISVGALTHSVQAADIHLRVIPD